MERSNNCNQCAVASFQACNLRVHKLKRQFSGTFKAHSWEKTNKHTDRIAQKIIIHTSHQNVSWVIFHIMHVAPQIVVHCCPLLSIAVHCCPLLSIVDHCCPLLPIVVHLHLDLPWSTDWHKCFCIYRLKWLKAISWWVGWDGVETRQNKVIKVVVYLPQVLTCAVFELDLLHEWPES